jgi:putative transcriptional regulator
MEILGNLLIAPPAVKNSFWNNTVIMVTEHSIHGSVGLVLNKRSDLTIAEFGKQLGIKINTPGYLYIGGPVNSQSLSMLHSSEWSCSNTMQVTEEFSVSSAADVMPRLALGDSPIYWRIFLGLAGWAHNQLLGEINGTPPWRKETSWCLTKPNYDVVFESDQKDQWCKAIDQSASEFAHSILL